MKVIKLKNIIFDLAIFILVILNVMLIDRILSTNQINNGQLEVTTLDIGQGDSILIKTPGGKYGLIDTGRFAKVSDELKAVLPFGTNELSFIVLTHPDADHIGGFKYLADEYKIDKVFINKANKETQLWADVKKIIADKQIPNYSMFSNNDFKIGDVNFNVVWPEKGTDLLAFPEVNDTSITMVISFNDFSIFSGGDLTSTYESKALKDSNISHIDALKVGHHGSHYSTSNEFLQEFTPTVAMISVGAGNTYGHPTARVLNDLSANGIKYYRTYLDGRFELTTDGYSMTINHQGQIDKFKT